MKYTAKTVNLSASEILGFPPSKSFNIKRLKDNTYRSMSTRNRVYSFLNLNNEGEIGMSIKNTYILSYFGFAATGVAGYAYFANHNTNIAFAAAGAALLSFYGAFRAAQSELDAKRQEEDMESVWRENGRLWDRCNELEDMIHNRVSKSDFDNHCRDNGLDNDAIYRHIDAINDENIRTLQEEMDGIHRRVDAVEFSSATTCETACSGKRSK